MPISWLFVNDVDMALTYNMWVNIPDGWADSPAQVSPLTEVPGLAGGFSLATEARVQSRKLQLEGMFNAATSQDAHDLLDAAKRLLNGPQLEVRFALWPDRKALCRCERAEIINVTGIDKGFAFRLSFVMPNPYLIGKQVDVYGLPNGVEVPLLLGSAPSAVSLVFLGAFSGAVSATYKDAQGEQQGQILLNGTLAATSWWSVDGVTYLMQLIVGGVAQPNPATLLSNASSFFVADPQDGDIAQGPTLVMSGCNGVAYVRKAWL